MTIKNIIFDLGGVIINIDYYKTIDAFRDVSGKNVENFYSQHRQTTLFDNFDIGKISEFEFRVRLKDELKININDDDFDLAWNAMLLDLPIDRLNLIRVLRKKYRTFLFSNTNSIHLRKVFNISQMQNGIDNFNDFFEKQYYSHQLGMRKPNKNAFFAILNENELAKSETLFVDDSFQHIQSAKEVGLNTVYLTKNKDVFSILDYINK